MKKERAIQGVFDFLVVGAGVIGVTVARELRRRHGGSVLVIEKGSSPALHASGRNSGVLHAGVYYKAGSLKARLCIEGNRRMKEYCAAKKLPINSKGKVIVARDPGELGVLGELHRRATANGVQVAWLNENALREVEPYGHTVDKALYVGETAVVDPLAVMEALVFDARDEGVTFRFDCGWQGITQDGRAETTRGLIAYGHFVNCAGLFADRIAHAFGVGREYQVLPFRGGYYRLSPQSRVKIMGNIYPVPDLSNPFLGVHFTKRPDGEVTVGPTALPLLGREQYAGLKGANLRDGGGMGLYLARLFTKNAGHFRALAWREIAKMTCSGFYREAKGLVEGLEKRDLLRGARPGIRAQLVDKRTGDLMSDFLLESGPKSTHVLNAVSPAFTCSLPFAAYVVDAIKLAE
jgi:L-2-hydroxyglutarate oxidase LhgO